MRDDNPSSAIPEDKHSLRTWKGSCLVTDCPIGATHDRLIGATCRPRKTGLEQVQFQLLFGVFATAGFGVSGVALGVR